MGLKIANSVLASRFAEIVSPVDPDARPKFEALVKSVAKMGHKPHPVSAPKKASGR
jgi:hypothetical protein